MYKNVKLLNLENDKSLKVSEIKNYKYSSDLNQSAITIDEFFKASKSQPIVFGKDANNNEYFAAALLGLKENNLFLNSKGEWKIGEYIPVYIRRYPFIFVRENDNFALAYDSDCKEINNKKGQELFDQDGNTTEYTQGVMNFMQEYQRASINTSNFVKELETLDLLEDATATIEIGEEKISFRGFKKVNEEKLNSLDDETILKLTKSGSYKLIIAHLISMSNFEKLVSIYNKK